MNWLCSISKCSSRTFRCDSWRAAADRPAMFSPIEVATWCRRGQTVFVASPWTADGVSASIHRRHPLKRNSFRLKTPQQFHENYYSLTFISFSFLSTHLNSQLTDSHAAPNEVYIRKKMLNRNNFVYFCFVPKVFSWLEKIHESFSLNVFRASHLHLSIYGLSFHPTYFPRLHND